jgi:hypothetical protein
MFQFLQKVNSAKAIFSEKNTHKKMKDKFALFQGRFPNRKVLLPILLFYGLICLGTIFFSWVWNWQAKSQKEPFRNSGFLLWNFEGFFMAYFNEKF